MVGEWGAIRDFFARFSANAHKEAGISPSASAADGKPTSRRTTTHEDFTDRLRATLAHRDGSAINVGTVEMLDMADVKARVADRWPRLAEKIRIVIERVLQKRLGEGDFYTRFGEDTYIVVFGDERQELAQLKCSMIGEEIRTLLFGLDEGLAELGVGTNVAQTDTGSLAEAGDDYTVLRQQILNALRTHGEPPKVIRCGDRDHTGTLARIEALLDRMRGLEGDAGRQALGTQATGDAGELQRSLSYIHQMLGEWSQQVDPSAKGFAVTTDARLRPMSEVLLGAIAKAEAELKTSAPMMMVDPASARMSFKYEPIWYVRQKTVGIYTCVCGMDSDMGEVDYYDLVREEAESDTLLAMDCFTLRRAINDLVEALHANRLSGVAVPVSFRTVNRHKSFQFYLAVCSEISYRLRDYIIWYLVDVPMDAWHSRLAFAVRPLLKYGRFVAVRIDPHGVRFSDLLANVGDLAVAGVRTIGFDVSGHLESEAVLIRRFEQLGERADSQRLQLYIRGIGTPSLMLGAVGAGADFLSGPVISSPIDHPMGLKRSSIAAIYKKRFAERGVRHQT